jgi:hypothetical protein
MSMIDTMTTTTHHQTVDLPLTTTITLLESLIAFYHQESMWVVRTRAQYEMPHQFGIESTAAANVASMIQDESSSGEESSGDALQKQEDGAEVIGGLARNNRSRQLGKSKWNRRKPGLTLHLGGIATIKPSSMAPSKAPLTRLARSRPLEMLDMFDRMVQLKMESCERVARMVRTANRADLWVR